jgi:hypothetical protein
MAQTMVLTVLAIIHLPVTTLLMMTVMMIVMLDGMSF